MSEQLFTFAMWQKKSRLFQSQKCVDTMNALQPRGHSSFLFRLIKFPRGRFTSVTLPWPHYPCIGQNQKQEERWRGEGIALLLTLSKQPALIQVHGSGEIRLTDSVITAQNNSHQHHRGCSHLLTAHLVSVVGLFGVLPKRNGSFLWKQQGKWLFLETEEKLQHRCHDVLFCKFANSGGGFPGVQQITQKANEKRSNAMKKLFSVFPRLLLASFRKCLRYGSDENVFQSLPTWTEIWRMLEAAWKRPLVSDLVHFCTTHPLPQVAVAGQPPQPPKEICTPFMMQLAFASPLNSANLRC